MNQSKYDRFCLIIEEMHQFAGEFKPCNEILKIISIDPEDNYLRLTTIAEDLSVVKQCVFEERKNEVRALIARNEAALKLSTFELMEHDFWENTHSNVLDYLFDYRKNGSIGSRILCQFVEAIAPDANIEGWSRSISKNGYIVAREKSTGNGRMDIFITDTTEKYAIVIENKVYASVGVRNVVGNGNESIDQLTIYRDYVERACHGFRKLYILLSHRSVEEDYSPYIVSNYKTLLGVLNSVNISDPVVDQYKILLHSMVNNILDKREIIEKVASLKTRNDIGLNSLELIMGAFNGN